MPTRSTLRYSAKMAYQLRLMTGKGESTQCGLACAVDIDDVRIESNGQVWRIPIAKAWLYL